MKKVLAFALLSSLLTIAILAIAQITVFQPCGPIVVKRLL